MKKGYVYRNDGDMRAHEFFLYSLVRGIRPDRILEIGVRTGVSTKAMGQAIADSQDGCDYHICDINDYCNEIQLPINVCSHIMSSDELAKEWNLPINLLMIDGCHEYSQVYRDFMNFFPFMVPGGFILFHDTNPSEQDKHPGACWDAYKILNDLKKLVSDGSIEFITLPYSYGLTIVRAILPPVQEK